jgi:hypothetical protein
MGICVEIEVDDDGTIAVGVVPQSEEATEDKGEPNSGEQPGQGEADEKQYLEPVRSIDEALAKAKELLAGAGQEQSAQEQQGFDAGFAGARGQGPEDA